MKPGDEGAVAFLDTYPSLEDVVTAVLRAQKVKGRSVETKKLRYFGLGRPVSLKQFIVDGRDPTSLLYAAQHGKEEMIRSIQSSNPDEEVDKNGLTALHYAAGRGDLSIVTLLLELKAGVDTRNKDLRTPLMWAARNGHLDVCEKLVRNAAPKLQRGSWEEVEVANQVSWNWNQNCTHHLRLISMLPTSWGSIVCTGLHGADRSKLWHFYWSREPISMQLLAWSAWRASKTWETRHAELPQLTWYQVDVKTCQKIQKPQVCHAGCNVAVWAATAGSFDMCQWLHEKRADFAATNKMLRFCLTCWPQKLSWESFCHLFHQKHVEKTTGTERFARKKRWGNRKEWPWSSEQSCMARRDQVFTA